MPYPICTSLGHVDSSSPLQQSHPTPWLEIRLDLLPNLFPTGLQRFFAVLPQWIEPYRNVIATFRKGSPYFNSTDSQRIDILNELLSRGIKFIDLDYQTDANMLDALTPSIKKNGAHLILSRHIYKGAPTTTQLASLFKEMQRLKPDLIKIAQYCSSPAMVDSLLSLYHLFEKALFIPMGPLASEARLAITDLGAPFTYAYYETPTAEGQLSVEDAINYYQSKV